MSNQELTTELAQLSTRSGYNVSVEVEEKFKIADGKLTVVRLDVSVNVDGTPIISDEFGSPDEMMRAIYDKVKALPRKVFTKEMYRKIATHFIDYKDRFGGSKFELRKDGLNILVEDDFMGGFDPYVTDSNLKDVETDFDSDKLTDMIEYLNAERERQYEYRMNTEAVLNLQFA